MATTPATPSTKSSAVAELDRLRIKYTEVAQYDLDLLSTERRIQIRDVKNYARKEDVERYATQMSLSEFPPIIVTADAWIVDGNTRVGAALKRDQHHFPALVLAVAREGADAQMIGELHALAATLNAMHGQPLTPAETRRAVEHFVALGWTNQQVGRAIGVKPPVISGVKKEMDARTRLKHVGINPNGELKGTSLRALGGPLVLTLNDEPYRDLAKLAADAGLNAGEIFAAAKEAKATGSDTAGVERIQQLRQENDKRIFEHQLTGVARPPAARVLRQALGTVLKFAGNEGALVETNVTMIPMHVVTLEQSIAILQKALTQQQAQAPAPAAAA